MNACTKVLRTPFLSPACHEGTQGSEIRNAHTMLPAVAQKVLQKTALWLASTPGGLRCAPERRTRLPRLQPVR